MSTSHRLAVVELKLREIDASAIAQVVRYMGDLRALASAAAQVSEAQNRFSDYYLSNLCKQIVGGILIGAGIKERHLLWTCQTLGIDVFIYSYRRKGDFYTFTPITLKLPSRGLRTDAEQTNALLTQAFVDVYNDHTMQWGVR